jgi:hypothetical protein
MDRWVPRVQVFPIVLAPAGVQPANTIFSVQSVGWLFDPTNPVGFPRYFADASAGFIDIDADIRPAITVTDLDDIATITGGDRHAAVAVCVRHAAAATQLNTAGFDGLVLHVFGGQVNAGAVEFSSGRMRNGAILDAHGSHSFMAHEIAHAIGMNHSYRPAAASPAYPDGEYGAGFCITSAQNWGGTHPTFRLTHDPASGIDRGATFWGEAGPGLSPATTWLYAPGFVRPGDQAFISPASPHPFVRVLPPDVSHWEGAIVCPAIAGVSLVAVPTPRNDGYLTFEYRPALDWDRGAGGRRASLVIHRIHDIAAMPQYGGGYRVRKVGRVVEEHILRDGRGASEWTDGEIGVRWSVHDDERAHVRIGSSIRARGLEARVTDERLERGRTPSGVPGVYFGGAGCDERTAILDAVDYRCSATMTVRTLGMHEPSITFTVGSAELSDGMIRDVRLVLDVTPPAHPGVTPSVEPAPVSLHCQVEGDSITITTEDAVGAFAVPVAVSVTESRGGPLSLVRDVVFETQALRYPSGVDDELAACARTITRLGEHEIPPVVLAPGGAVMTGITDWAGLSPLERAKALGDLGASPRISLPDLIQERTVASVRQVPGRRGR